MTKSHDKMATSLSELVTGIPVHVTKLALKEDKDGKPVLFTKFGKEPWVIILVHPERWQEFKEAVKKAKAS